MSERQEVTHLCPPAGSGVMPCCGRTPFERLDDRITLDPALVTCAFEAVFELQDGRRIAGRLSRDGFNPHPTCPVIGADE